MENFIVSARKYRPQNFETVVGQQHITTTLKNAIAHHQLAHAYLFCGPRGVGKTTCARIFAKTINCEHPDANGEPCNECDSCRSFNEGTSLNIAELDAASNNSVDDIRELVSQVRFVPQSGKYKVYIIDEVHMLSQAAFNAFLKTLEEPPSYVVFILATTEKHKLLPTILSRCQIFDFKRMTSNDTVDYLASIAKKEHFEADRAALQVIASKSEGCMRDALSLMDKIVSFTDGNLTYTNTLDNLNILDDDYYFKLLDALIKQDLSNALLINDEIHKKGFEGDVILNGFSEFLRNVLVCKDAKAADVLLNVVEGKDKLYKEFSQKVSASYLISGLNILNEAEINFKTTRNKRLHVEMTLIKLNYLMQALELSAGNGDELLKKKQLDRQVVLKKQSLPIYKLPAKLTAKSIAAATPPPNVKSVEAATATTTQGATLKVETPAAQKTVSKQTSVLSSISSTIGSATKRSSSRGKGRLLDKLMDQVADQDAEVKPEEVLEINKLQTIWNDIGNQLIQEEKHSAGQTFLASRLRIIDDVHFEVSVNALTQQKFIEQDRSLYNDAIQNAFHNRNIVFNILIEQAEEDESIPLQKKLNSQERFEYLAQKYPLLRTLKMKLSMKVDF